MAAVFIGVLLSVVVGIPAAWAHTGLETSEPGEGDTVATAVERIELVFTKPIELLPQAMRITSPDGESSGSVTRANRSEDGMQVVLLVDPPLYAGEWVLHWRVLASDSHPREGTVAFAVDASVVPPAPDPTTPPAAGPDDENDAPAASGRDQGTTAAEGAEPPVVASGPESRVSRAVFERSADVARVVYYLGLMVALGVTFFKASAHRGEESYARRFALVVAIGAVVGLVGGVLEVVAHVGGLAGRGLAGVFDGDVWAAVLRTGLGTSLVLRVSGLLVLLVGGIARYRRDVPSGPDPVKFVGAAMVLLSFQFVGHTASTGPPLLNRAADLVHAVAAAVWVGGMVGLAMLGTHEDRLGRARTAARFSVAAGWSVLGVAVAGSAMAWLNLPDVAALWETTYGRLLVAKLALVGVLAVLGAINHHRVVPRLTDGDTDALDYLRRTVGAEVVVVIAVISLTALLINTSPT